MEPVTAVRTALTTVAGLMLATGCGQTVPGSDSSRTPTTAPTVGALVVRVSADATAYLRVELQDHLIFEEAVSGGELSRSLPVGQYFIVVSDRPCGDACTTLAPGGLCGASFHVRGGQRSVLEVAFTASGGCSISGPA